MAAAGPAEGRGGKRQLGHMAAAGPVELKGWGRMEGKTVGPGQEEAETSPPRCFFLSGTVPGAECQVGQ